METKSTPQRKHGAFPPGPRQSAARTEQVIQWLRCELHERLLRNPSYSLRAFSQSLEINHSQLVRLLNGKRACSPLLLKRLEAKLGPLERPQPFNAGPEPDMQFAQMENSHFVAISDWEHFAIRELANLSHPITSAEDIADLLNIPRLRASVAMERLLGLGYIVRDPHGYLRTSHAHMTNQPEDKSTFTSAAHRKLQRTILARAIQAIDLYSASERDQSSMTMAVNSSRIPEAIRRIQEFRRSLCQFLEGGPRDRVYHLSVSLFPESKILENEGTKRKVKKQKGSK